MFGFRGLSLMEVWLETGARLMRLVDFDHRFLPSGELNGLTLRREFCDKLRRTRVYTCGTLLH